jgi:hypothetical protein
MFFANASTIAAMDVLGCEDKYAVWFVFKLTLPVTAKFAFFGVED